MENKFEFNDYKLNGNFELMELLKECLKEIDEKFKGTSYAGYFNFCKNLTIQWGHTTGKILGRCHYDTLSYDFDYWGRKRIKSIDKATITIYDHKGRDIKGIKETIIHELIHTLRDCEYHRSEFKWYCDIIKRYLGYSCFSGQHEDLKSLEYLENFKHFLVCQHCHKILSKSNRMTKRFKSTQFFRCTACKNNIEYMNLKQVKGWL